MATEESPPSRDVILPSLETPTLTKADLAELMQPGVTTAVLLPDPSGAWTWVELQ